MRTEGPSCACGCPSFTLVPDRSLPAAEVEDVVPIEAHGIDPAGNSVGVLLFVQDGYLSEVEVFSFEGSKFAGLPDPGNVRITQWSAPDEVGARYVLNPWP